MSHPSGIPTQRASAEPAASQHTAHVAGVGRRPGPLHPKPGKLLALDVGLARIGLAVCDPLQLAARPLTTLTRRSRRDDFSALAEVVRDQEIIAIVCGLPLNMDGSEGPQAATTRKWALRLAQALRVLLGQAPPLLFWDERLSSYAAREIIQAHKLRAGEDAVAAAVILQSYLDHLAATPRPESRRSAGNPRDLTGEHPAEDAEEYDAIVLP